MMRTGLQTALQTATYRVSDLLTVGVSQFNDALSRVKYYATKSMSLYIHSMSIPVTWCRSN